jgi:hypothetical protein
MLPGYARVSTPEQRLDLQGMRRRSGRSLPRLIETVTALRERAEERERAEDDVRPRAGLR